MFNPALSQDNHHVIANRRGAHRLKLGCTAVVWAAPEADGETGSRFGDDGGLRVVLIDSLSLTGLSFVSFYPCAVDTPMWVRIRLGAKTCQFKGVVRRVSAAVQSGRTRHLCGVQFVRSQQTAHALAVISSFIATTSPHQNL